MGMVRGLAKALGKVVFSVALTLAIVAVGLAEFTSHDSIVALLQSVLGPQLAESMRSGSAGMSADEAREVIAGLCEGKDSMQGPSFDLGQFGGGGGLNVSVDCAELKAATANATDVTGVVGTMLVEAVVDGIYYSEYSCDFVDCLRQGRLLVVMSEKGNQFFASVRTLLIAASAASAVVIIASCESWPERLKALGVPMLFVGVSYVILTFGKGYVLSTLPADAQSGLAAAGIDIGTIVGKAIEPMMGMLLALFVAGAVLTVAGYIMAAREAEPAQKNENRG